MTVRARYGGVDPLNPEAAGRCDRTGVIVKRSALVAEMRWAGNRLVPTGLLVRPEVLDRPQPQDRVVILPADPQPVRNPRFDIDADQVVAPVLRGLGVLVEGGALGAAALFRRAHVPGSARAYGLGTDNLTYLPAAADTPRFVGSAGRLLMEGAFSNLHPNANLLGAVPGLPGLSGTLPTGWSVVGLPSWLTYRVEAVGLLAGLPMVQVLWTAASAVGNFLLQLATIAMPLGPSRSSFVVAWSGGSTLTGMSFLFSGQGSVPVAFTGVAKRQTLLATIVNPVNSFLQLNHIVTPGAPLSVRVFYAGFDAGAGGVAGAPVLPFPGMPAPSSVAADRLSASLGALGVNGVTAFRLRWRGALQAVVAGEQPRSLIEVCDQSGLGEVASVVNVSGNLLSLRVVTGGIATVVPIGSVAPQTVFDAVLDVGRDGGVSASLNGGASVSAGALERVLLALVWVGGQDVPGNPALWGEVTTAKAEVIAS